ncbi:GGDEF domain-containing protein [Paenibacillus marchantiophytorum]|uniref:GGDEF domain-containing protein n=1 Tax=Paenibacillus marchantiophytorum TaxID=1619310 RepID=A0ABQ1EP94_9BACL|nr:diguanylate cyclase [Paenibacillus marchantiophytorum]GFZ79771.1 GGDEF domain-containing protein [Paenibacillus marchantiophytorum]
MNNTLIGISRDLIANFAIVTAYLFLTSQVIFKNKILDSTASISTKVLIGFSAGILGIVLMVFTVEFDGTILDFRQIAVIISALFGGIYASILTGLMIFFMRLFAFGVVSHTSVIAASNTIFLSLAVGVISRFNLTFWKKWIYALVVCNVSTAIVFFINLGTKGVLPAFIYVIMLTVGGLIAGYLTAFLVKAKSHFQRMEKAATFDFLTELNNHRTFDEVFNVSLQKAIEKNESLSLLMIDIDHFKKINDTYGHSNGDVVLKQFGKLLKDASRSFDIVSRNGGEEFSILLYDLPHKHALVVGDRVRSAISKHAFVLNDGQTIKITVSIGAATYPDTKEELIEQADKALYKAKMNGRNKVISNQEVLGGI